MERTPVESSQLASVGYNADTKILEVEFARGAVYQYFSVEPAIYKGLMAVESVGQYFNKYIKDTYSYQKVGG